MNKKIHFALIAVLIFLSFASNCKKPPSEPKYMGTYPLGDIKDYLYFKPGSMWVYECDSTGELDTLVMMSNFTYWEIHSYIKIERLSARVKSLNEGSTYEFYEPGFVADNPNYKYYWGIVRRRTHPILAPGAAGVFFKPFDTNVIGGYSYPTYYKGVIPKYNIQGIDYDSVRVFKITISSGWPLCNSWRKKDLDMHANFICYWAKGIGLVKTTIYAWDRIRNVPFTHNWEIKYSKIIK